MKLVSASVTEQQLFDLSAANEANERLSKANPFG
jgi:hypothetical protein